MLRSYRAFTLIELLVVIAIIAILAAILFPVFAQAKLAAKKSADLSNMKQVSLGMIMYSSDNDDVFPLYYSGPDDSTASRAEWLTSSIWSAQEVTGAYTKSADIMHGPEDTAALGSTGDYPVTRPKWTRASYMPNTFSPDQAGYLFPDLTAPRGVIGYGALMVDKFKRLPSLSQTAVGKPADVILLAPGRGEWDKCGGGSSDFTNTQIQWYPYWTAGIGAWGWDIQALTVDSAAYGPACVTAWRKYNGGANFAFVDGHAKALKPGDLVSGASGTPNPNRWLANVPDGYTVK